jgi:uncharacterized protein with von Willebrand factor type A (vWA) domain
MRATTILKAGRGAVRSEQQRTPARMIALSEAQSAGGGALAQNIVHFARALREAGVPLGPGAVLDAIAAVEAAGIGDREDFYATLHAVLIKKHEHSLLFDQAFQIFWKRKGLLEKLIAMLSPRAPSERKPNRAEAGASRVADALFRSPQDEAKAVPSLDLDARFTMSEREILRSKDFAQMSTAEIDEARKAIKKLVMPEDNRRTRRFAPSGRRLRIDARRSFRRSLEPGGAIDLEFQAPTERPPPIVALCDISGSMSEYTRLFLHFLHALGERRRVSTFLFGTRLTNVTRAMRARDPDEALAQCSALAVDWSGGTRIGETLARFSRVWSRRVLGQGAITLLFTDGLERDGVDQLEVEMERLAKSSRRVIWVNPLLRFDGFSAKARGVRAMLPHVDEFRPIHNLASMADLCKALSGAGDFSRDPQAWLQASV